MMVMLGCDDCDGGGDGGNDDDGGDDDDDDDNGIDDDDDHDHHGTADSGAMAIMGLLSQGFQDLPRQLIAGFDH